MNLTFQHLQPDICADLANMKFTEWQQAMFVAHELLAHRDRFLDVQTRTRVPALWLMPVFERENPSFMTYFGNGDPLDRPTTHVPRGRGPFSSWEDGVIDALHLDHIIDASSWPWTWEFACYEWERWNGFGPREHGRPSGYVWSGTSVYRGGKYVADGVWSRGAWDHQLGCVVIAKAITAADSALAGGLA